MSSNSVMSAPDFMQTDADFDALYPLHIRFVGRRHWTPLDVAKRVMGFLGDKGAKILDIGSGVGKFCLAAAYYAPDAELIGVEQRKYLISHAQYAQEKLGLTNVTFINKNFTQLNLHDYTHFYFFNSFFENIDCDDRIDETIDYSEALYEYYVRYLYKALQEMPKGTKIATFHTLDYEIPDGYKLVEKQLDGDLSFWLKQ